MDGDISRGGTSATQQQKVHTDDVIQCLHKINPVVMGFQIQFVQFYVSSGRFWEVLCLSANKLQQNSNASSREDYIP